MPNAYELCPLHLKLSDHWSLTSELNGRYNGRTWRSVHSRTRQNREEEKAHVTWHEHNYWLVSFLCLNLITTTLYLDFSCQIKTSSFLQSYIRILLSVSHALFLMLCFCYVFFWYVFLFIFFNIKLLNPADINLVEHTTKLYDGGRDSRAI